MRSDGRYWILDPAGHRQADAADRPADGTTVDFLGGEAIIIAPPLPDDDDWLCDLCSTEPILTRWGDEPWPVPAVGSYALCNTCREKVEADPRTTDRGDPIPGTRNGPWPWDACTCHACTAQLLAWHPHITYALRHAAAYN